MFVHGGDTDTAPRASFTGLLARAGLGGVPRAALAGSVALVMLALAFVGWRLGGAAAGGEFTFESHSDTAHDSGEDAIDNQVPGAPESPAGIWVHVAGAVRVPGLYELAAGARVGDALARAGGPLDDAALDAVNLARLLQDGEQVYVPVIAEVEAGQAAGAAIAGSGAAGGVGTDAGVDINSADAAQLEALPGVGPATAAKIVADRDANGPFAAPEDIMRVPGIGEKKFESMREMIVVR
jgi:competence protein ComEA